MRTFVYLFRLLTCTSLGFITACGGGSSSEKDPPSKKPFEFTAPTGRKKMVGDSFLLSGEIPELQQEALAHDLSSIPSLKASFNANEDALLSRTLGVSSLDGASLKTWLSDRLAFFMGEKLSSYNFALVYPKEASFGYFRLDDEKEEDIKNIGAANVGTGLFNFGRKLTAKEGREQYLRLEIDGTWRDITSPRIGIMQIGPALFDVQINPQSPEAFSNSIFRLHIIFHEARHSDGNAANKSLGFTHALCPESEAMAAEIRGKLACDMSTNGAYTVGALMLRAYYRNCGNKCTQGELAVLKSVYLDAYSRVVPHEITQLDPQPEKAFQPADISSFNRITIE